MDSFALSLKQNAHINCKILLIDSVLWERMPTRGRLREATGPQQLAAQRGGCGDWKGAEIPPASRVLKAILDDRTKAEFYPTDSRGCWCGGAILLFCWTHHAAGS
jgi:hypothetical protein